MGFLFEECLATILMDGVRVIFLPSNLGEMGENAGLTGTDFAPAFVRVKTF
ncbi:MAG: hypothetical protein WBE58_11120 [Verrucomicrobiales bacterium]